MKTRIFFFLFISGLFSLLFIDNIAIRTGDENIYVTRNEAFESRNPGLNQFGDPDFKKQHESAIDMPDFQDFVSKLADKPLYKHDVSYLDTTGDGDQELIGSHVEVRDNGCLVHNYIEKNGNRIWDDTFFITENYARLWFGDDELFETYKPYVLYYIGITRSDFTEPFPNGAAMADYVFQIKQNKAFVEQYGNDDDAIQHITSYKGQFVFNLNPGRPSIYMWSEEKEMFVPIFEHCASIDPA